MATQTTNEAARTTTKLVTSLPGRTVVTRLVGVRPSRTRAFLTATAAAVGGATLVYRLLRSGDDK